MIERGEIFWAESMDGDRRPVVIVSRELLNRGSFVVCVPCTSRRFEVRSRLANCVQLLQGEFGLTADCVAQAEVMTVIPVNDLDQEHGPIGRLDAATLRSIIRAIGYVVDADCEPR